MKKFKFSLQPLLSHRERLEDDRHQAFGARRRELQASQEELARLHAQFQEHTGTLRDAHAGFTSEQLRWHYAHLEYLDRRITMQHADLSARRMAAERARTALVHASRDRQVIERLKGKRLEEHRLLEAAFEQKEFDDANNRRHRFS